MAIKKDLTGKLSALVDYIREETEEKRSWITLTYRDIAKIVGTTPGSSITKRLMEGLKEHENILFKLNLDPKKSKKPLQFQFVDKETKFKAIDNKRYRNLTPEEVEAIKTAIGHRDHTDIYNVLSYINYLKSMYGNEPFTMPSPAEMSDLLLILEQDVIYINDFLKSHDMLIDENGKYRLFLDKTGTEKVVNLKGNNKVIEMPKVPAVDLQHLDNKPTEEAIRMLMDQLTIQQNNLRAYLEQKVLSDINQISSLKTQLDEGHQMIQKVLDENQDLRNENQELKSKISKLEANLDRAIRFKDDLINATQEYLQIFNWQVQQVASKDSNTSASVKNTKAYRAKLFQQYIDVGQEFYDNIVNFTKN